MYSGYFTVGGNEVGNNARALGYQRTSDCPVTWLRDDLCNNLHEALGDEPYEYASIETAPWYDPDSPDVTGRFLGLSVISMEALSDSTRSAQITEKIVDGAQVSGYRHSSRQVRIRALLTAHGMDALESGMTWLRNVLEPDACGVHGGDCGASDFQFFVDCPPTRASFPGYTAYTEVRRNLILNPNFETNASNWNPAAGASLTRNTTDPISGTASGRLTVAGGYISQNIAVTAGEQYVFSFDYKTLSTVTGNPRFYLTQADGTPVMPFIEYSLPLTHTTASRFSTPPYTIGPGGTSLSAVIFAANTNTIVLDNLLLEKTTTANPYFDGNTTNTDLQEYAWTGTVNGSASTLSERSVIQVPETEEEYTERVNSYRRVLHTVTCISGPLVQSALVSSDKQTHGYIVEFTMLAAVPFVFGLPREIDVPPLTPTVIEDAAFNLEPYPSAELSTGTLTAATNFSTNPSVEVNATGWAASTAIVSGSDPAPYFTSGRVTGELAANGTSSYRVRILGNGSTAITNARSYMYAEQSVAFSTGTGVRVSFNVWAACVEFAGASGGVINGILVEGIWRATTTVLSTVTIGSTTNAADFGGKAFTLLSQLKPPTANNVLVRVRFDVTWSSSTTPANNSEIRGYVDALAVTVP